MGFGSTQFMSVLLASPLNLHMYHKCHLEQEGTEGAHVQRLCQLFSFMRRCQCVDDWVELDDG